MENIIVYTFPVSNLVEILKEYQVLKSKTSLTSEEQDWVDWANIYILNQERQAHIETENE